MEGLRLEERLGHALRSARRAAGTTVGLALVRLECARPSCYVYRYVYCLGYMGVEMGIRDVVHLLGEVLVPWTIHWL